MSTYPAMRLWDAEVRKGVGGQDRMRSSTWHLDALHAAACCEANAREATAAGLPVVAAGWMERATAYLAAEVVRRAA